MSMWKLFALVVCIADLGFAQQNETVFTISLFATDLKGCDSLSACDAVVRIVCSSVSSDWKECGKTSEIKDDNFPVWPERFTFTYKPEEHLRWRFDVVDQDLLFDDPIGSVTVGVEEFLISTELQTTLKLDLNGRGSFYIHRRIF